MSNDQLTKARDLVRQLSFQEKLYLLNDLTMQVIQHSNPPASTQASQPLPSIHFEHWPHDLPLRREELYDDRSR